MHFIICQCYSKCKKHEVAELEVGSNGKYIRISSGKMLAVAGVWMVNTQKLIKLLVYFEVDFF